MSHGCAWRKAGAVKATPIARWRPTAKCSNAIPAATKRSSPKAPFFCSKISRIRRAPILLRGVGVNPDNPEAWDALGLALTRLGDVAMAESAFAEAGRLQPQNVDFALHWVEAAASSGRIEAEIARLQAATAADPLSAVSLTALALALDRSGQRRAAADMAQAAAILAPDMAQAVTLAGVLLARSNRLHEAEALLRKAVALDPNHPAAGNDHAAVLMRIHRHAEARAILSRMLDRTGPSLDMLGNLATAETSLGLQEQGTATATAPCGSFRRFAAARLTLLNNLPYRDGVTGEEMLAAARELSARLDHPSSPRLMNDPAPDRRLRIGLLSGSMRTHPVGWLTIAGFGNLDPAQQTLIGLAQREGSDPDLPAASARSRRNGTTSVRWTTRPWRHSAAMTALTFWSISAVSAMPGVSRPSRIGPHPCRSNGSACRPTPPPAGDRLDHHRPLANTRRHRDPVFRTTAAPAGRLRLLQSAALRTRSRTAAGKAQRLRHVWLL